MSTWTAPTAPLRPPDDDYPQSRWKVIAATVGVVLLILGALTAAWALGRNSAESSNPSSPTVSAAPVPTATSGPTSPAETTPANTSPANTAPAPTASASAVPRPTPVPNAFRFQPLWPFASVAEAVQWQRSGGPIHQPGRLDPDRTALTFTHEYLGYEMRQVVSRRITGDQAWIGIGVTPVESRGSAAAVLHLARIGTGTNRPWEVVGSQDTSLSITAPRYGSTVTSPLTVGGRITGVDESLHVRVLALGHHHPLGEVHSIPAGGVDQPWSVSMPYRSTRSAVITVAVSTGGHLDEVEKFAITGLRTVPAR